MRAIPPAHRKIIDSDAWYRACCFPDKKCKGRTEIHHALIYARSQISELWNYIPLCHYHHNTQEGKDWASLLAITRMTSEDRANYPKRNWGQESAKYFYKLTKHL